MVTVPHRGRAHNYEGSGFGDDVSADFPCPACGKDDWCSWYADGRAVFCRRPEISGGLPGKRGDGGHTVQVKDIPGGAVRSPGESAPRKKKTRRAILSATDTAAYEAHVAKIRERGERMWFSLLLDEQHYPDDVRRYASTMGLPPGVFKKVGNVGFYPFRTHPCDPDPALECYDAIVATEFDADGKVIGLRARTLIPSEERETKSPVKVSLTGSWAGLTLPLRWRVSPGPLFIPEGMTDCFALRVAGLGCVGRPSNRGGVDLLVDLLRKHVSPDRQVVWLCENDQKPDGTHPGDTRDCAQDLATLAGRPIWYAFPPEGAKDVRAWLTARCSPDDAEEVWATAGAELKEKLLAAAVEVQPKPDDDGAAGRALIEEEEALTDGSGGSGEGDGGGEGDDVDDEECGIPPDNPHRLADEFLAKHDPLWFWRADFWRWDGSAYYLVPREDFRAEVVAFISQAMVAAHGRAIRRWEDRGSRGPAPMMKPVTRSMTDNTLDAIRSRVLLAASTEAPAWIDGGTGPDPLKLLSMKNGLLDLEAASDGKSDCLRPAAPEFFTLNAAPFKYDPAAPEPVEWLRFLGQLWAEDVGSINCLQEWFGLLLTPDTSHQKILFLHGPSRSGKGTIARVLTALLGKANVAGPTLATLAGEFGLWPLLGKSAAIISDARLGGRTDAAAVTERLLTVSGEDAVTVNRKGLPMLTVKLPTRFVILSNEMPKLGDDSGALPHRFIVLGLTRSFIGKEERGLSERLIAELPGILKWALAGWKRLRDRGHLLQPESGAALVKDLHDLASPIKHFVRERCVVAAGGTVPVAELYGQWKSWCDKKGKHPGAESTFGRAISAAFPEVMKSRLGPAQKRVNTYSGIRIRKADDPDPDGPDPKKDESVPDVTAVSRQCHGTRHSRNAEKSGDVTDVIADSNLRDMRGASDQGQSEKEGGAIRSAMLCHGDICDIGGRSAPGAGRFSDFDLPFGSDPDPASDPGPTSDDDGPSAEAIDAWHAE